MQQHKPAGPKTYKSPSVTRLGALADLTAGGSPMTMENTGMMMNMQRRT